MRKKVFILIFALVIAIFAFLFPSSLAIPLIMAITALTAGIISSDYFFGFMVGFLPGILTRLPFLLSLSGRSYHNPFTFFFAVFIIAIIFSSGLGFFGVGGSFFNKKKPLQAAIGVLILLIDIFLIEVSFIFWYSLFSG